MSTTMFSVKPFYNMGDNVELPNVMYKMKNLVGTVQIKTEEKIDVETLKDLKIKQENLLEALDNFISTLPKEPIKMPKLPVVNLTKGNESDIVIFASPENPPHFLKYFRKIIKHNKCKVLFKVHVQSSYTGQLVEGFWKNEESLNRGENDLVITLIWRKMDSSPIAYLSPTQNSQINGETNIAKLLARILGLYGQNFDQTMLELQFDACEVFSSKFSTENEKSAAVEFLSNSLKKSAWLGGNSPSVVDAVALSLLHNSDNHCLKKWVNSNFDQLL